LKVIHNFFSGQIFLCRCALFLLNPTKTSLSTWAMDNVERAVKRVAPGSLMQPELKNLFAFWRWRWRMGWWETDGKREGGDVQ